MQRILFVDDQPLVLQGLQRMLRPMRAEWDMEFVTGGEAALNYLAQKEFDVVVSDMRMPGMNGAELLGRVMELYPKTIRFILSGYADRDLILKCVGTAHQYLAKPCDPEALKTAIRRATHLVDSLKNRTLLELVGRLDHIPSVPELYQQITLKLQNPEVSVEEVAAVISRDIAMTAQLLRLVNSAFFGLPREIVELEQAVAYLGLSIIKALVLSLGIFQQYEANSPQGTAIAAIWDHTLRVANAAKELAATLHLAEHELEESYVAGLLHDCGRLVLTANLKEPIQQVQELARAEGIPAYQAEEKVLGATHADVGGYLLGLWGLPVPVVEAIALHHAPRLSTVNAPCALTAVHIADALVNAARLSPDGAVPPQLDEAYLARLGLDTRLTTWQAQWTLHAPQPS